MSYLSGILKFLRLDFWLPPKGKPTNSIVLNHTIVKKKTGENGKFIAVFAGKHYIAGRVAPGDGTGKAAIMSGFACFCVKKQP